MKRIYLQTIPTEEWGVVMEGNSIDQVVVERPDAKSLVGNLYKARIVNIETSLQAAFVDFGQSKLGFLKKNECPGSRRDPSLPIEKLVHEGQAIWVQVTKDAFDEKGAQLTANITLPGMHLVYLPFGNYHAVSKKVDDDKRSRLKEWAKANTTDQEGIIFRTSSAALEGPQLMEELRALQQQWAMLQNKYDSKKPPVLAWEDRDIPQRLLRRYPDQAVEEVVVDDTKLVKFIQKHFPHLKDKCRWAKQIEEELPVTIPQLTETIAQPLVKLEGGAEIRIDQTEAMVVVDVNTAKNTKRADKSRSVVGTNLQAAKEIANQLKLRNLSGMIIIDFIGMRNEKDQQQVLEKLKKSLHDDPFRTEVYGFTKLGLVEMTRKREGRSLLSTLTERCDSCSGNGYVLSVISYAYQLERELLSYQKYDQEVIVMEVRSDVAQAFHQKIDVAQLKSTLYKDLYFLNNRISDVPYRIRFIGDEDTLRERDFYQEGSIDRL
ncbi:Rne/Rng family ribonuclease [Pontibacillus yanchengensis]|uniref:Rne/Rng family ribonuclease n=1 Tax=Pontibacillus yanchengensis TaxID=462910 RepID=A0ACC7VD59_9BACI|nr:Rne/Rng family ribonuclease [Pontibacillus yanchengensis]MYL53368.1 Rne/Rng family ribonuclease [Pontibacillus yanchengensis]